MFKKYSHVAYSVMAALLVFISGTGIGTNSWFTAYEPTIPECLKRLEDE